MGKNKHKKREYIYLGILFLIIIGGGAHTIYEAYSLYNCNGCSAPYTLAFIFPGGLYLILLGILAAIYYFIKKKYILGSVTFLLLILVVSIILLSCFGLL